MLENRDSSTVVKEFSLEPRVSPTRTGTSELLLLPRPLSPGQFWKLGRTQPPSELGYPVQHLLLSTVPTLGVAVVENVRWQLVPLHGLTKP